MSKILFGITFEVFHLYKLLPLFVLIFGLHVWQMRKRMRLLELLAAPRWRSSLLSNAAPRRLWFKLIFFALGLFFLYCALLRPAWGKKEEIVNQQGRDLLIALDVSKSMLAQDRMPDRLGFAKEKIRRLVSRLQCERVGLMLFSGSTIIQCPLTSDHKAFFMFLDQIDAETISSGTTALDQAILKAVKMYEAMPSKKHKLLVIFTDGEDFSSNLADIKARAVQLGLTIFTFGLGTTEGSPIPLYDDRGAIIGHQKDHKGNVVITRLNEGILKSLASETGGIYMRAESDGQDIKRLVSCVKQFEKEAFEDRHFANLQERYPYFVAASLMCFALEWLL